MYTCNMTDENEFYFWDEMWNEEKNNKIKVLIQVLFLHL